MYGHIGKQEVHLSFVGKDITCKVKTATSHERAFVLRNTAIKFFFRALNSLGLEKVKIGVISVLLFPTDYDKTRITLLKDSFAGTILDVETENESILKQITKAGFIAYNREELGQFIDEESIPLQGLFDEPGVLNQTIKEFARRNGIDLMADSQTLQSRLEGVSNDYSNTEMLYKSVTGANLLSKERTKKSFLFAPMSIVVPAYNANKTIAYVLAAIDSQDLTTRDKQKIQVIVIDDGSKVPVQEIIRDTKYSFDLNVVRLEKNQGLSNARNIGLSICHHGTVLFMDADILLSKTYLYEHNIRNQVIPNALFVSFRKNIGFDDPLLNLSTMKRGIENPNAIDDSRVFNQAKKEQAGWGDANINDRLIELLDDTNYFKNYNYGNAVGVYDLPGVVSGHNISLRRENALSVRGFSTEFQGWGLEDKHFAAKVVSQGNYVNPVLNSSVYHIGYGPRGGDQDRKINELNKNYEAYQKLLQEGWY